MAIATIRVSDMSEPQVRLVVGEGGGVRQKMTTCDGELIFRHKRQSSSVNIFETVKRSALLKKHRRGF